MKFGRALIYGIIAAAIAFGLLAVLRAVSPASAWVNLLFRLFPEPGLIETARLIMLFALGAAAKDRRNWLFSAVGFVIFGAIMALMSRGDLAVASFVFALSSAALQMALTVIAFALLTRQAPPFLMYCVLALVHGAHNGGLIALERAAPPLIAIVTEAALAFGYTALILLLWRWSNAVRGEDRRLG